MTKEYIPQAGDIGFTQISGITGWLIRIGQTLAGDPNRFTHAFVVVDDYGLIEAMPGGLRWADVKRKYKGDVLYARFPLTSLQRQYAERTAYDMMHSNIKYSFTSYLLIGMLALRLKPKWLQKYIANSNRLICSQVADRFLWNLGYHVFDDGRVPQDVTPGDLVYAAMEQAELFYIRKKPSR